MEKKKYFSKVAILFTGIFLAFFCAFFLSANTALAQSISGTVLVDGVNPTGDLEVVAYDSDDPEYEVGPPPGGPALLDYNAWADVSTIDGSYTLSGLTEGHRYKLLVRSALGSLDPFFVKSTWYGNVSRSGLSSAITVSGDMTDIDFNVPAADGTYIQGKTSNCPESEGADMVYVAVSAIDPDMWVHMGSVMGLPNDSYDFMVLTDLYADEEYRVLFGVIAIEGEDMEFLGLGFYDNRYWESYECAGLAFGNATGINHDFAAMRGCGEEDNGEEENGEEENGTSTIPGEQDKTTAGKKLTELPQAGSNPNFFVSLISLSTITPFVLEKLRFKRKKIN